MSERSFAVWSVGLALVFGMVVPEPGQPRGQEAAVAAARPQAPPRQEPALDPLEPAPFSISHAGGAAADKAHATPVLLWAAHNAP